MTSPAPRLAFLFGGMGAGAALAAVDLLLPALRPGDALDRFAAAAILPALGSLTGLVAGLLAGRGGLFAFALLVAEAGRRAALGPRASQMFLAPAWAPLAALGTLSAGLLLRRLGPRRQRGFVLATAAGAWTLAVVLQRGRYHALREVVFLAVMVLLTIGLRAWPQSRWLRRGLGLAALGAALLGGLALQQDRGGDWVQSDSRATYCVWWRLRPLVARAPETSISDSREPMARSLFGTPLERRSRELFAPVRGVLVISVDALRGDALGFGRPGPSDTPVLDALAARGRRFDRAYTNCPISQPAVFSAWSGLLPSRIVADPRGFQGIPLITQRLEAAGIETRAAFPEGMLTIRDENFDRLDLDFGSASGHGWNDLEPAALAAALRPRESGPWFAWAHLMRPHYPYRDAAPAYREGLDMDDEKQAWRSEVRHADADIGLLLENFRAAGLLDEALVIVTADHGEAFGEHGAHRHGAQLYEETIRVPFLAAGPGVAPGRDPRCISLVDLAPTLDHLFDLGEEGRPAYQGRSLLPLLAGLEDPERPLGAVVEIPPLESGLYEVASALVSPTAKLILRERLQREEWYDLRADPGEKRNLARREPNALAAARRRLRRRQTATGTVTAATFAAASAPRILRERGHQLPPSELYEFLRHRPTLDEEELLPWLVQVARCGDPRLAAGLGEIWAEDPRPRVRRLARILRGFAAADADERAAILGLAAQEDHPELRAAIFAFALVKRAPGLANAAPESALAPAIAQARYRFELFGERPSRTLINRGLAASTPHLHRRATLRLAARSRHALELAMIRHLVKHGDDDQLRIEAIAACPPLRGQIDVYRWLEGRLDLGSRAEQEAVFEEILLHPQAARDFRTWAWYRPEDRERATGLRPGDPLAARIEETGLARLPLELFPEGNHLALFLHLEDPDFRRNRVRIEIGDFRADVIETSRDPTKPRVFWLPPTIRAEEVVLRVLAGDPRRMRVAGLAVRAASREPPRRFGTRAY
jgi:arylsulfatase A-like enzyme